MEGPAYEKCQVNRDRTAEINPYRQSGKSAQSKFILLELLMTCNSVVVCVAWIETVGILMANSAPLVSIHDAYKTPSHTTRNSNGPSS